MAGSVNHRRRGHQVTGATSAGLIRLAKDDVLNGGSKARAGRDGRPAANELREAVNIGSMTAANTSAMRVIS